MAVAFDARTLGQASGSFSHTPVGTPRAVIVGVVDNGTTLVTAVTYGGVALARVDSATDTGGENGCCDLWFLGENIPTGTQTVAITGAHDECYVATFTADADTEIAAVGTRLTVDQADPQIAVDSGTRSALRVAVLYSGQNAPSGATVVANTTSDMAEDLGNETGFGSHQNSPSTGSFTIGWTSTIEDVAMVAAAIAEKEARAGWMVAPLVINEAVPRAAGW